MVRINGEFFDAPAAFVRELGLTWPDRHPAIGEPFVDCDLSRESQRQLLTFGRPSKPEREVYEYEEYWDEYDSMIERRLVRTLTDEEFDEAMAQYRKALHQWERTQGRARSKGPTITRATFRTASGWYAKGLWVEQEKRWEWTAWGL